MGNHANVVRAVSSLIVLLATAGWSTADLPARQRTGATDVEHELRLIDALDERIQDRFKEADASFGLARIVLPDRLPHLFDARTLGELSAVRDLERAGLRVVLYLAGRNVLRASADAAQFLGGIGRPPIRGPILVTPADAPAAGAAIAPLDLWADSRAALLAFTDLDATRFVAGDWMFIARPVRASDTSCLNCHRERSEASGTGPADVNALRPGDPLAAVLYGYQRRR